MGNFSYRFPTNLLTSSRENAESGNPAMMKFKNKRFAYCSEPDASRKVNINNIKEITGDELSCRALYSGDQEEFKTGASIFVCSQSPLDLDKVDNGFRRRIITIPYDISFVDHPTKPNERKRIDFTREQKDNLKYSMLDLLTSNLIDLFNTNNNFKFEIPERFTSYKNDYLEDIDELTNFIKETIEFKEGERIKASEVLQHIRNEFKKGVLPQEIKSKIKNIFGVEHIKRGDGNYYLNIQLKNNFDDNTLDGDF